MNKLPQELRLIISREIKDQDWQLDNIMHALEDELKARERAVPHDECQLSGEIQGFSKAQTRSTTSALFAGHSGPTCTYCKQSHPSNACKIVTNSAARKDLLIKQGRCFVCLRKDHLGRNCKLKNQCFKCKVRHHISICPSDGSNEGSAHNSTNLSRTPSQEQSQNQRGNNDEGTPRTAPRQEQNQKQPMTSTQNLTALYVSAATSVLLQTAKALTYKPSNSAVTVKARFVLDSGSQRTYVSTRLRERLKLLTENTERISIKTFGSTNENSQCVDVVRLCVATEQGQDVELSAFVVPTICDPLQSQSVVQASLTYAHLKGLKLADYHTGEDNIDIDIPFGSDQYWSLVSGRVVRGGMAPLQLKQNLDGFCQVQSQKEHKLIGSKVILSQHM